MSHEGFPVARVLRFHLRSLSVERKMSSISEFLGSTPTRTGLGSIGRTPAPQRRPRRARWALTGLALWAAGWAVGYRGSVRARDSRAKGETGGGAGQDERLHATVEVAQQAEMTPLVIMDVSMPKSLVTAEQLIWIREPRHGATGLANGVTCSVTQVSRRRSFSQADGEADSGFLVRYGRLTAIPPLHATPAPQPAL